MQDLEVFCTIFALLFVCYIGSHKTTMNQLKADVPNLQ
ncbi:protein YER053C-A [Kluyveromyces marxianus]|uniref:Protein YER053C-A n=1 Tax=Kluyveromyces marxianus TaxID=4911 RepID=A0ABX6EVM7_KLUMA|nr:protein YER053C-A [Kluyveromyces marxianus]